MNALLMALLQQVVIPEIAVVFRAHANAGLPPPTSDQIIAALGVDTATGIQIGQAWLAAHPETK